MGERSEAKMSTFTSQTIHPISKNGVAFLGLSVMNKIFGWSVWGEAGVLGGGGD